MQTSSKASAQPILVSKLSKEAQTPSIDRSSEKVHDASSPAPWHRAVTDERASRCPVVSQPRDDGILPLPSTPEGVRGANDPPTTESASSRSRSPPPINQDIKSWSVDAGSSSPHIKHLTDVQHDGSQISNSQIQELRSTRVTPESSTEHLPSTPKSDEGFERLLTNVPDLDRDAAMKRTLRRTPRSRRINSLTPPVEIEEASPSTQEPPNERSMGNPSHEPWSHQPYSMQSTTSASTPPQLSPVPSEKESKLSDTAYRANLERGKEGSAASNAANNWKNALQPFTNGSTTLPASPPLSEGLSDDEDPTPARRPRISNQAATQSAPLQRSQYPLQSPASVANLRHSPSPPLSPAKIPQHSSQSSTNQDPENKQAPPKGKILRRQAYPLQSPASSAMLRHSPTTSSSSEKGLEQTNQPPTARLQATHEAAKSRQPLRRQAYPLQSPASHAELKHSQMLSPSSETEQGSKPEPEPSEQVTMRNKTLRRQAYPLQSPVSTTMLRCSRNPPFLSESGSEHATQLSAKQLPRNPQDTERNKAPRRQAYPLQSPASFSALRNSPAPSALPEFESKTERTLPTDDLRKSTRATGNSKSVRRQAYPLQSPASVANLQSALLPPSIVTTESPNEDPQAGKSSREHELATRVVKQWRRQVYPMQLAKDNSPFERSPTPHLPGEEVESYKPPSIHIPKNIRAVADAEKHDAKGRTIVVCLDGTGDKFDNDNSNIVHLISALKKDDSRQVTYYQAGIGTYSAGGLSNGISAALDMAVGSGLGLHVRDAYHFLMHTYKEGDKICIFGFSRGAYTARCLAGMVHKVGLLPPRNIQQIPFAYEFYANDTKEGWKQSEDFKKTFCIDVCVHFLGCFDSVASVGFIPRQLPLSSTPTTKARYFRHAMALDERRAKFKICRHQTKDWDEIENGASPRRAVAKSTALDLLHSLPNYKELDDAPPKYSPHSSYGKLNHPNITDEEYDSLMGHETPFDTDVLEVWFAGAHADIGGGAVSNDERHKLAQIPLRWMIRQAFECDTGIIFKTKVLAEYGLDVHTLWPKYKRLSVPVHGPPPSFLERHEKELPPRSIRRDKLVPINKHENGEHFYHLKGHTDDDWTPEQVEDFYDALTVVNDQLVQAPTWWILEAIPVEYKVPTAPGKFYTRLGMNLGRYRGVEDSQPNLHWTVQHRVQHMGYKIEARTAPHTPWRVVV